MYILDWLFTQEYIELVDAKQAIRQLLKKTEDITHTAGLMFQIIAQIHNHGRWHAIFIDQVGAYLKRTRH